MRNIRSFICVALVLALVLALGCTVPAESYAPGRPVLSQLSATAEESSGDYEYDEFEEEFLDDGEDDVVMDPDEEMQFLDDLTRELEENKDVDAINGMINILLIGLDARPNQKTGRSDTMILMTLDNDHNCIKLTSFMRDLYVEIPGRSNNRLNAAYVFGGAELLMKTLEKNFGVTVDYYVAVDFSTLADVIDQLGGLTITVEDKYVKRVNAVIKEDNKVLGIDVNDGLLKEGGEQVLTGKQAQAYARYRYGDSQGDFGRTVRQREVIMKCMDKVKDMSMVDLVGLAVNNLDKVSTDMSLADMISLAPVALSLRDSEVRQLRIPMDGAYKSQKVSGMAVLVPNRKKILKEISSFILENGD